MVFALTRVLKGEVEKMQGKDSKIQRIDKNILSIFSILVALTILFVLGLNLVLFGPTDNFNSLSKTPITFDSEVKAQK